MLSVCAQKYIQIQTCRIADEVLVRTGTYRQKPGVQDSSNEHEVCTNGDEPGE